VSSSSWLSFSPRDTVFIRDGRSFDALSDATAHTVWPSPTTIAGAVGAALPANPEEVRGPMLARRAGDGWEPYFPVPADLVRTADRVPYAFRMVRTSADGQTDLDPPCPGSAGDGSQSGWLMPPPDAEPAKQASGWMPGRVLARYLAGGWPGAGGVALEDLELVKEPLLPERRVGLARDEGRRARTGFFYQSTHLRPDGDWAFLAECAFGTGQQQADSAVSFGGRGRLADVAPAIAQWPEPPPSVKNQVLVYLATPALWADGWQMPIPSGAHLVAAATGEPEPTATITPGDGWAATRMLRWAVPAGSVYLLEFDDAEVGASWARKVHGTALERGVHGIEDERDKTLRTAGFGVVLTGVWT
jgi:CRISPR type III-B/RAMP module-associated protein Cmr3